MFINFIKLPSLMRRGAQRAGWLIPLSRSLNPRMPGGVAQCAGVCCILSIMSILSISALAETYHWDVTAPGSWAFDYTNHWRSENPAFSNSWPHLADDIAIVNPTASCTNGNGYFQTYLNAVHEEDTLGSLSCSASNHVLFVDGALGGGVGGVTFFVSSNGWSSIC